MNKKHIVVIEDDTVLLTIIGKLLQSEGYSVTNLETLSSVEDLIESKADCFIIDEHLPNVSGHIICMLLKAKPQTMSLPVILMSAFEELEYFADLSCANVYLKKPFNKHEIISRVSSVLSVA
jgi:DNA-binding response OmpR family regulator